LQQMTPEAQAESKKQIFLDAVARIGKIDIDIEPEIIAASAPEFAYRMRARFQIKHGRIGFFAPGTRKLIPIEGCLLVEESIRAAFAEIREFLKLERAARVLEAVEISSLGDKPDKGAGLFLYPIGWHDNGHGTISKKTRRAWEVFSEKNGWPLAAAGGRKPAEPPSWKSSYELKTSTNETAILQVSPEAFLQPNRRVNESIVRAVLEMAALPEGGRAVDLFCGAGNFAVPLAEKAARIVGVESNQFAVKDAEVNAKQAGLKNTHFIKSEAGRVEANTIEDALGGKPDLVLLDPPRPGALETIPLAVALKPNRIVYVSCNPATFARDARELSDAGYRMEAAFIAPMFPNTAHVESVTSWAFDSSTAP
ncbi:MAG: class I SAM-dependent RNA methyltransferase, partial [Nitrospinaceae bacterium]|nr:class I SAM-dependent RNA methyltransferase [Nitrospinaceae bacterium]